MNTESLFAQLTVASIQQISLWGPVTTDSLQREIYRIGCILHH